MSRSELLVLLLLVPRGPLVLALEPKVPALSFLEESLHSAGRDFSQIYTGWVNSSFLYPYYLKVIKCKKKEDKVFFVQNHTMKHTLFYVSLLHHEAKRPNKLDLRKRQAKTEDKL